MNKIAVRRTLACSVAAITLSIFALSTGAGTAFAITKLGHDDAVARLTGAGIGISSSGGCSDPNNSSCTALEGVNLESIDGIITFKNAAGCGPGEVVVTGGTETGHAGGDYSHANGYKLDIGHAGCVDSYITGAFSYIGLREGDNAPMYQAGSGNVYADEGNHWDITYYSCGC